MPVIVLLNKHGCAVARSDEGKALGSKTGEPLQLVRSKVDARRVDQMACENRLHHDAEQDGIDGPGV